MGAEKRRAPDLIESPLALAWHLAGYQGEDEDEAKNLAVAGFEKWSKADGLVWMAVKGDGITIGPVIDGERSTNRMEDFEYPFELDDLVTAIADLEEYVRDVEDLREAEWDDEFDEDWGLDDEDLDEDDWDNPLDDEDW